MWLAELRHPRRLLAVSVEQVICANQPIHPAHFPTLIHLAPHAKPQFHTVWGQSRCGHQIFAQAAQQNSTL